MNDPHHYQGGEPVQPSDAVEDALEKALAQPADLPFFDLDIKLIRRGVQTQQPTPVAPDYPRERRALAALESLMAERQRDPSAAPVTLRHVPLIQPKAQPKPQAKARTKTVEPRIMPAAHAFEEQVSFVSPAVERMAMVAVEPLTAVVPALLQAGREIADKAADRRPDLQLQSLKRLLALREAQLFNNREAQLSNTREAQRVSANTVSVVADNVPDDLPWGHVTYRLLVM